MLMPISGIRFVRVGSSCVRTAVTLTVSAIPGVLIAAYLVDEMSLDVLRWLVVVVVTFTASMMLRSAWLETRARKKTTLEYCTSNEDTPEEAIK
jgi:uncharacterized membrane protein YfcA